MVGVIIGSLIGALIGNILAELILKFLIKESKPKFDIMKDYDELKGPPTLPEDPTQENKKRKRWNAETTAINWDKRSITQ